GRLAASTWCAASSESSAERASFSESRTTLYLSGRRQALTKRLLGRYDIATLPVKNGAMSAQDFDLWADVTPPASRRLLLAALDAFAEHGYFATTTRQIAERANLSPAAVYIHYVSKAEMLGEIC